MGFAIYSGRFWLKKGPAARGHKGFSSTLKTRPKQCRPSRARLRALSRRPPAQADPIIRYGDVVYDTAARDISVGEAHAPLSRGESIVLERFLRAPGRVITKDQLGDSLHSLDQEFTDNSIQVHVHRVRRKLADMGANVSIRTLRGLGYMAVIHPGLADT